MSGDVEQMRGEGVAELVDAILREPGESSTLALPSLPHSDVAAALLGAEAGAAIGLLWFGWTPLMPIAVTLAGAATGPLLVRASRPLRLLLFRHWLRSQLGGPAS